MTAAELIIGEEARAEATALVNLMWTTEWSTVEDVRDMLAAALQVHINRAELAEIERRKAVDTMQGWAERVREVVEHGAVESWVRCSRCGARGPSLDGLEHAAGCSLSSRPPPRATLAPPPTLVLPAKEPWP